VRGTKGRDLSPPARRATEPARVPGELGRWPGAQAVSQCALFPPALRSGPNRRLSGAISAGGTFVSEGPARGTGACPRLDLVRLGGLVVPFGAPKTVAILGALPFTVPHRHAIPERIPRPSPGPCPRPFPHTISCVPEGNSDSVRGTPAESGAGPIVSASTGRC